MYTCTGDQSCPPHCTGQFGVAHPRAFRMRCEVIMSSRVKPSPSATLSRIGCGISVRKKRRASSRNASSSSVNARSIAATLSLSRGALQPISECLAELRDLWRNDRLAIASPRIAREIVVVFRLCLIEYLQRLNLSDEWRRPNLRVGDLLDYRKRGLPLLIRMGQDD